MLMMACRDGLFVWAGIKSWRASERSNVGKNGHSCQLLSPRYCKLLLSLPRLQQQAFTSAPAPRLSRLRPMRRRRGAPRQV